MVYVMGNTTCESREGEMQFPFLKEPTPFAILFLEFLSRESLAWHFFIILQFLTCEDISFWHAKLSA